MKYFDIRKIFTQIVSEKLNEHCVLATEHMRSTQTDEIAKIDYVDPRSSYACPNHLYRVLLEHGEECVSVKNIERSIDKIVLKVLYFDNVEYRQVAWNKKGKVFFKKSYYKIDDDFYTTSLQEAEDALNLKLSRRRLNDYDKDVVELANTDKFNTVATKYVKHNIYRFANNVSVKKKQGGYFIGYTKKNGETMYKSVRFVK